LLAARGLQNQEIAAQLNVVPRTVARWRDRFAARGIAGIKAKSRNWCKNGARLT